jgi:ABC-2 type transport system permease protein
MKRYVSFFKMRLIAGLQYRTAALAGLSTQLVWGTLEILLYRAFYLDHPDTFPMGMQALSSYIWLQQAFLTLFAAWMWETELFQSVQNGTVAYELLRPVDLYGMWMFRSLALRLSRCLLRAVPVILVASLIPSPYGLRITVAPQDFLLFLLSMTLMLWVVVAMGMLCYSLSFYLVDAKGLTTLISALTELLSGSVVPLPFFPEKLRSFAELGPFGAMQNVPLRIFGGDITNIPRAMGLQLFWAALLTLTGYVLMQQGVRRTTIAGG